MSPSDEAPSSAKGEEVNAEPPNKSTNESQPQQPSDLPSSDVKNPSTNQLNDPSSSSRNPQSYAHSTQTAATSSATSVTPQSRLQVSLSSIEGDSPGPAPPAPPTPHEDLRQTMATNRQYNENVWIPTLDNKTPFVYDEAENKKYGRETPEDQEGKEGDGDGVAQGAGCFE